MSDIPLRIEQLRTANQVRETAPALLPHAAVTVFSSPPTAKILQVFIYGMPDKLTPGIHPAWLERETPHGDDFLKHR